MSQTMDVRVPDIGDFKDVPIIELHVKEGDKLKVDSPLITLETAKAAMEVPSPYEGVVKSLSVKVGDKVSEGSLILSMEVEEKKEQTVEAAAEPLPEPAPVEAPKGSEKEKPAAKAAEMPVAEVRSFEGVHASPSVRRFARELGADLSKVRGSGPKGRLLREDVQSFVKGVMTSGSVVAAPSAPQVDFSKFGPVEEKPLSRIQKISGANLARNWASIPHVTQHDEVDITELEAFRKSMVEEAQKHGVRLTLPAFLMKACAAALRQYPTFNASLSGETLVLKQYCHIGMAVDTQDGLVVPVIRDADRKSVFQLAKELSELSAKAREGKLSITDMQGGCFSISSLGGIGGGFFTPIINAPEVAILGVSKAVTKPVYKEGSFVPRLMLPLSLSYDHRVIDGAMGAKFIVHLGSLL
ncbi:MAG TPA: dihydrolipoyllysine-residue acetyltransferase, partial [Burkholderiales bacterium]|nr:dihydrolipoyllysine-residue acetyltransferase [Burkholderiales bacterium]